MNHKSSSLLLPASKMRLILPNSASLNFFDAMLMVASSLPQVSISPRMGMPSLSTSSTLPSWMSSDSSMQTVWPSRCGILLSKPRMASLREISMVVRRSLPSLLKVGWLISLSFTQTSPGQKSNPCSLSPLNRTTSPFFMPFSNSKARSRGAIMILLPPQTGQRLDTPVPDPPQALHFISIFFTSSFTFTSRTIFPEPPQTGHGVFQPPQSPVPLQCLQISPLLKLQTIYPPVQNLSKGTHISVLKSPPFLNGFFQSYLSPASPWRSQVILLETSMSISQALLISTYFLSASQLSELRSGWYLMDSLRKAFLSSSLVAFSVTSNSQQRRVSRCACTNTISRRTAAKLTLIKVIHVTQQIGFRLIHSLNIAKVHL